MPPGSIPGQSLSIGYCWYTYVKLLTKLLLRFKMSSQWCLWKKFLVAGKKLHHTRPQQWPPRACRKKPVSRQNLGFLYARITSLQMVNRLFTAVGPLLGRWWGAKTSALKNHAELLSELIDGWPWSLHNREGDDLWRTWFEVNYAVV